MPRLLTHLTPVALSMLNSEVRELIDALLYRLSELEQLSGSWKAANRRAESIASNQERSLGERFEGAFVKKGRAQTAAFHAIEAFLAAWARLSLLFFPQSKDPKAKNRGEVLRKVYLVDPRTSPLADRQLRNAWMHFDERLDQAIDAGTLGNRQQFTTAARGRSAATDSVRVVEMDSLVVRYRDSNGTSRATDLRVLSRYLEALDENFRKAQRRFRTLTT